MKIISSKSILSDAISMVQKAISTRSTLPILDGILMEAEDRLTLTGYDLETGIECRVETEIREKGSIVVNAKMFGDIVRKLPEDLVSIESDADLAVYIRCGKASFKIKGLSARDYPKIPVVEEALKLQIRQGLLKEMIAQTIFAASSDESRPILNGINVIVSPNKVELVAIDGFRLAVRKEENLGGEETMQFIVPAHALADAARIFDSGDAKVEIYPSHNHILFDTGRVRLVSRLIQGDFMQYQGILPQSCRSRVQLSPKDLLEAIERASLVINVEQRRFPVTFSNPSQTELLVSARTDLGQVDETIEMKMTGDNLDIDFNPKYFLDALRNISDEKVIFEFSGPSSPCLIKPAEGDAYVYLVLPLRR